MKNKISFLAFFLAVILAGCGGGSVSVPQAQRQESGRQYSSSQEIEKMNSQLVSQSVPAGTSTPAGYLIGPADLLEIRVFESDKLNTTVRVSSRGEITVPLLNNVYVEGMTAREAEIKLENLLKNEQYIDEPHVGVFVMEHKSKVVSVMGYVNQPGVYELVGRKTLLDALAYAQGLNDEAGTLVYVTRTENDGSKNSYLVDLDELLASRNPNDNLEMRPGDVVYVPEAANVFVDGAVFKPGAYPINEGETTVSEAIVMAGGVMSFADKGAVKLIRYLGNGRKEVLDLDLGRIQDGEEADPILNEKDAVVVGASGIKSFFYGLNFNVFGLGGLGYDPPAR